MIIFIIFIKQSHIASKFAFIKKPQKTTIQTAIFFGLNYITLEKYKFQISRITISQSYCV